MITLMLLVVHVASVLLLSRVIYGVRVQAQQPSSPVEQQENGITCLNGGLSAFITSRRATPAESDLIKPTVARVISH